MDNIGEGLRPRFMDTTASLCDESVIGREAEFRSSRKSLTEPWKKHMLSEYDG